MVADVAQQTTVCTAASLEGVGLHTGALTRVTLHPAEADTGIVFVRSDLPGAPEVRVRPESVARDSLTRRTMLREADGTEVSTTEHLLATCLAMGLDNARIELNGPEVPILDGSANGFVDLIERAGLEPLEGAMRFCWKLPRPVSVVHEGAEIVAVPAEKMQLSFFATLRHAGMPNQVANLELAPKPFRKKIAPARTFVFYEEVEPLFRAGLIRGGTVECCLVIHDGEPMGLKALRKAVDKLGPEASTKFQIPPDARVESEYRSENELASHKLLDLVGDLAVLGRPVNALISARGAGHALNYEFVETLRKELMP